MRIHQCPWCGNLHTVTVELTLKPPPPSGATPTAPSVEQARVVAACLEDGRSFIASVDVTLLPGQKVVTAEVVGAELA